LQIDATQYAFTHRRPFPCTSEPYNDLFNSQYLVFDIGYWLLAIEQIVEEIKLLEIILAIVMQFTSNNLRLVGEPITFLSCISSIIPTPQHTGLI
jgi:hypothetical protein